MMRIQSKIMSQYQNNNPEKFSNSFLTLKENDDPKKYLEVASSYFGQLNYKGQAIFDYLYIWMVAINNDSQYDFTRNPYALETVEKLIRNKIKIKEIDIDNVNSIANNFSTTFSSLNLYKFVIDQLVEQNMRIREIEQQLYIINRGR